MYTAIPFAAPTRVTVPWGETWSTDRSPYDEKLPVRLNFNLREGVASSFMVRERSLKLTFVLDSPILIITGMVIPKIGVSLTEIAVESIILSSSPNGFIFWTALK